MFSNAVMIKKNLSKCNSVTVELPICNPQITIICDVLRDLVPFVSSKKREKHPWRSVIFSKPATLLKVTLLHGRFSHFLNCTNTPNHENHRIWIRSNRISPIRIQKQFL